MFWYYIYLRATSCNYDKSILWLHALHWKIISYFFLYLYLHENQNNLDVITIYNLPTSMLTTKLPCFLDCEAFSLDTVNILRKYSSLLDVPLSYALSSCAFTVDRKQYSIIQVIPLSYFSCKCLILWTPILVWFFVSYNQTMT